MNVTPLLTWRNRMTSNVDTRVTASEACSCGLPAAFSLNPAEVITHRSSGPCTIEPVAKSPRS